MHTISRLHVKPVVFKSHAIYRDDPNSVIIVWKPVSYMFVISVDEYRKLLKVVFISLEIYIYVNGLATIIIIIYLFVSMHI